MPDITPSAMKVLLPLQRSDDILEKTDQGFQPLKEAYDLIALSSPTRLAAPRENDGAGKDDIKNAGETAIPDVCAHVQYLRTKLAEQNLNLNDEAVRAWIGVMAIIAVSELRPGFKLSVELLDMNGGTDIMKNVYRDALRKEHLLDADGYAHVLKFKGNPIALLDIYPKIDNDQYRCFCYPFSTIDNPSEAMSDVKWFIPGYTTEDTHKRVSHYWMDVTGINPNTAQDYLTQAEKAQFVLWLNALKKKSITHTNSSIDFERAVDSVILALNSDIADRNAALLDVETTLNNPNIRPQNIVAWRGVLACIALSQMRGSTVSLELFRKHLPIDDPARDVFLRYANTSSLMFIKVNGARVGLLDSSLRIRPFYYVTDTLNGIPWFRNGRWCEISSEVIPSTEMDPAERRKLAGWYQNRANLCAPEEALLRAALNDAAQDIINHFGSVIPITNSRNIFDFTVPNLPGNMMIPAAYTSILSAINSVPDFTNYMPPEEEMFTPRLLLTMVSDYGAKNELGIFPQAGGEINNTVQIVDHSDPLNPRSEMFQALLPLRSSFTQLFSDAPGGLNLKSLSLTSDGDSITVHIIVQNDGANVARQWTYSRSGGTILYYEEFPYLSMWPYVRSTEWKKYFVTLSPDIQCYAQSSFFTNPAEFPLNLTEPCDASGTFDGDANHKWMVRTYNNFPEYIHFSVNDGGSLLEVGSIYVTPPKMRVCNRTYYAAIDFGSANTIVRLTDGNGKIVNEDNAPAKVFTNDYVKPLVKCSTDASFIDNVGKFHEFYWLPYYGMSDGGADFWTPDPSKKYDRLPTVIEAYSGASLENHSAPRFGQFLRSNCEVMSYFLGESGNKGIGLEDIGIFSNIKMQGISANGSNLFTGQIAIEMILLECALAALKYNARLSFIVSYPDDKMWGKLKQYWLPAVSDAMQICSSILVSGNILKTTELWAAQYYATEFAGDVNPLTGYCIIDIGGGTSDISLWRNSPNDPTGKAKLNGALSLKYAGNQIMSESIFSFYRRMSGPADIKNFRSLWNKPIDSMDIQGRIIQEYELNMEQGFRNLLDNPAFESNDNIKKVHQQVPILSSTIVADGEFSNDVMLGFETVQSFRSLVRVKLSNVFYVLAQYLRCLGPYVLDMQNPLTDYVICLAGGGAGALEVCDSDEMKKYLYKLLKGYVFNRAYKISNIKELRKTEVVNGMCTLIQEKLLVGGLSAAALAPAAPSLVKPQDLTSDPNLYSNLMSTMRRSYDAYVEGILKAESNFFAIDGTETLYDWLTLSKQENFDLFVNNGDRVMREVLNEIDIRTTPIEMASHIAAIKLIDYILLVYKFK